MSKTRNLIKSIGRAEKDARPYRAALLIPLLIGAACLAPHTLYSQTNLPAQPSQPSQPAQPSPQPPLALAQLSFAGAQIGVGGGFKQPLGVAVDASGDVFIADTGNNRVLKISAAGAQTTVGSGLNMPSAVAVDAAGDVFIADTSNGQVVEVPAGGGAQMTVLSGLSDPTGVAADQAGDVYIADPTSPTVLLKLANPRLALARLGSGLNQAKGVALDSSGNLFIADTGNNRVEELSAGGQTTVASGLNQPTGVAVAAAGDVFIANMGANNVVELPAGGAQTMVGVGLNQPTGVAVDAAGDVFIADSGSNGVVEVLHALSTSVNLGMANVCSSGQGTPAPCSQTATLNYYVTSPGEIQAVNVLTQGTPNLDFTLDSTTCVGELETGASCSVTVMFAPRAPGLRMGAVQMTNTSNGQQSLSGATLIYGQGQGPAVAFGPAAETTIQILGLSTIQGVAVDAAGDIFVSDAVNNRVVEVPAGGGAQTTLGNGLAYPTGLAIDGAGDLFITDNGNDRVVEVPSGGGAQITVASGLHGPQDVAVDGAGDVFIADFLNSRVLEVSAAGTLSVVGSGLINPSGLAVDGAGDLFISDYGSNRLLEAPAGGGAQMTLDTELLHPFGVAVDAAGDVFISDVGDSRVVELPAGGEPQVMFNIVTYPVKLDSAGNLFYGNLATTQLQELQRSQPQVLSFPSTAVGSVSDAQSITLQNIGNQPLNALTPGLNISANFEQQAGSGTPADCNSSFSLTPGASCNLSIAFAPQSAGNLQGTATLTDNALNATAAIQAINLSGTSTSAYDNAIGVTLSSTNLVYPGAAEMEVSGAGNNGTTATGSVTIYDGTTALTTLTLNTSGQAWWWINPGLNAGTHLISASYGGDANNPSGHSAPVTVVVAPVPVTLSVSCWFASFPYGGNQTCSVSVSSNAGQAPGSITYSLDGGSAVSVPLSGGDAQFTMNTPAIGSHTVVTSYSQQGNFAASAPNTQSFTVTPASTQ